MNKKRFNECPYLWKVQNNSNDVVLYAFANTPAEALELTQEELNVNEPLVITLVCFANDIVNFK